MVHRSAWKSKGRIPSGRRAAGAGGATVAILERCLSYLEVIWSLRRSGADVSFMYSVYTVLGRAVTWPYGLKKV